jgi:hypothetical protein
MPLFRKKPVTIEARQLTSEDAWPEIAAWCGGITRNLEMTPGAEPQAVFLIPTLEGEMRAQVGDWIIRGVKGEFYPCKPDIFAATYEAV